MVAPVLTLGVSSRRFLEIFWSISPDWLSIRAIPFVVVLSGASGAAERKGAHRVRQHRPHHSGRHPGLRPRHTGLVPAPHDCRLGLVAAAATTAAAALVHAAGVSLEIDGEMIPLLGFAQMTFVGAVVGGVLLAVLNRWSAAPRRRFVQAAVALTALSCVPSIAMPADAATKVALTALHLLAAAIIVPVLLRHAND